MLCLSLACNDTNRAGIHTLNSQRQNEDGESPLGQLIEVGHRLNYSDVLGEQNLMYWLVVPAADF